MTDDEFPEQGFAAVADDVPPDLREPDGEVDEGERVYVESSEGDGPGC